MRTGNKGDVPLSICRARYPANSRVWPVESDSAAWPVPAITAATATPVIPIQRQPVGHPPCGPKGFQHGCDSAYYRSAKLEVTPAFEAACPDHDGQRTACEGNGERAPQVPACAATPSPGCSPRRASAKSWFSINRTSGSAAAGTEYSSRRRAPHAGRTQAKSAKRTGTRAADWFLPRIPRCCGKLAPALPEAGCR